MDRDEFFTQSVMEKSEREFIRRCRQDMAGTMCETLPLEFESCDIDEKSLTVSLMPEPGMSNPSGVMHGGMVASLFDQTIGSLTFYMAEEHITPTINLQVNFLRPVALDRRLYIKAYCQSCGKTMAYATAEMWNEGGKIAATATGIYSSKR
jgi:uncharacterized protein (TIGR00369 family)